MRGHARPHLLDWDGDGRTDLVLSDRLGWNLYVCSQQPLGELVRVHPVTLPIIPNVYPQHVEFTDWDGDGRIDVILAGDVLQTPKGPWVTKIYGYRNVATHGPPVLAPPVHWFDVPPNHEVNGFAVVNQQLVVSITTGWQRNPQSGWTVTSQLWLYRRAPHHAAW